MPEPNLDLRLEIAHVLFIDVVGYSKLLIDDQRELQEQLNQIVRGTAQCREGEAEGKLVRLPTGDGMALVFFTSAEAPVQCALEISEALQNHPQLRVRMGINTGPVSGVADVNSRSNVAGGRNQYCAAGDGLWRCRTYSFVEARRRRFTAVPAMATTVA